MIRQLLLSGTAVFATLAIAPAAQAEPVPYLQLKGHKAVKAMPVPMATDQATFTDTFYTSTTDILEHPFGKPVYENPVLPGFYPDPSIVRVGADYYLINSSFAYYPGIPVFHSKDLVNWQQIGNAIDRPGMLDFSGLATSRGVFAPQISYHNGLFWIINTCVDCKGNFVITAKDPAGPWSAPAWLDFDGIDPSIFWDDDGKAWVVNNGPPEGTPLYDGHRAIWLQQFDPATKTLVGPRKVIVTGGSDIAKKPVWVEGPHLYKVNGAYYLLCAEGGTEINHSEVAFRSSTIDGPYTSYAGNPILTQRDLDPARAMPIHSAGHADLVQTAAGDWFAVFLATQPYDGNLFNTGRQTFMLPVKWQKDTQGTLWPTILAKGDPVPLLADLPNVPGRSTKPHLTGDARRTYTGGPTYDWLQIRTPAQPFLTVSGSGKSETLHLKALPEAVGDVASHPAFIGLRQKHVGMSFTTTINYVPAKDGDRAGILALQNDDFYIFYGLAKLNGKTLLTIARKAGPNDPRDGVLLTVMTAPVGPLTLTLDIDGGVGKVSFGKGRKARVLMDNIDVTNLSTEKAGGFVGTIVGIYAYGQK